MSLSATIQGNGITATLQAAIPAATGSHITPFAAINDAVDFPTTWGEWFSSGVIAATQNRVVADASATVGWYISISCLNAAGDVYRWTYNSPAELTAGNGIVDPTDLLYVYAEYSGAGLPPQSTTVTIRNATYSSEIVWQITLTINPEPA